MANATPSAQPGDNVSQKANARRAPGGSRPTSAARSSPATISQLTALTDQNSTQAKALKAQSDELNDKVRHSPGAKRCPRPAPHELRLQHLRRTARRPPHTSATPYALVLLLAADRGLHPRSEEEVRPPDPHAGIENITTQRRAPLQHVASRRFGATSSTISTHFCAHGTSSGSDVFPPSRTAREAGGDRGDCVGLDEI